MSTEADIQTKKSEYLNKVESQNAMAMSDAMNKTSAAGAAADNQATAMQLDMQTKENAMVAESEMRRKQSIQETLFQIGNVWNDHAQNQLNERALDIMESAFKDKPTMGNKMSAWWQARQMMKNGASNTSNTANNNNQTTANNKGQIKSIMDVKIDYSDPFQADMRMKQLFDNVPDFEIKTPSLMGMTNKYRTLGKPFGV
jgi:hypothetical protein